MLEMTEYRIDEIALEAPNAMATGPFGSAISSKFFQEHGVPVIRGGNLSADISNRMSDAGLVYVSHEKAKEFSRSLVKPGDLVFTCWGTINQVGLITDDLKYERYVISNKQMKLTVDPCKADPLYLYYLFSAPEKQAEILANGIGAAVPGFNLGQLKSHRVLLPRLEKQHAISSFLDKLDRKIRLNTQTNQTLESIAQALFKSWFVDFEPVKAKMAAKERWYAMQPASESASPVCYTDDVAQPDLETYTNFAAMCAISGKNETELAQLQQQNPDQYEELAETAALFPSAMVSSELGEIPEGWEIKKIEHILELAYGKSLGKTERIAGDIPVYGSGGLTGWHNKSLVGGPGIIVGRKGTVGSIYWEKKNFFPIDTVFYVVPKDGIPLIYTYYLLQTLGLESMNTDAAVPGLNRNNVYRLDTVYSSTELIKAFSKLADSLRKTFDSLIEQSDQLIQIRDSLLPKLLSGEISLENYNESKLNHI